MIFREVNLPDGTKKYQMGHTKDSLKDVPEDVYFKLMEDNNQINTKTSDNIKMPKLELPEMEAYSESECEDGEFCEDCQGILDLIFDLNEMDEREAIDTFRSIIFKNRREGFLEGMIASYDNLGSLANKMSARIENQLDDLQESEEE